MSATQGPSPSLPEGAYWIRNKTLDAVLGLSPTSDSVVGQEKVLARKSIFDYSQIWLVEVLSDGTRILIRSAKTGLVLDVKESNATDGTPVILYTPTGNDNQHWTVEWVDDDEDPPSYRIVNVYTKTVLTQTTNQGQPVVSWSSSSGPDQRWYFEPVVFLPVYRIDHVPTGWCIQYDGSGKATAAAKVSATADSRAQFWVLEPSKVLESKSDGDAYVIRSLADETRVLDLSASGAADGTPVIAYAYHGGPNQQWYVNEADAADPRQYRIVSVRRRTVVQVASTSGPGGTLIAETAKPDLSQCWRLEQLPSPSPFWATVKNLKTGKFLGQKDSTVIPSGGSTSDHSVQWRLTPDPINPHHYTIINRASGWVVTGITSSPTVGAAKIIPEGGYLWVLEAAGEGVGIGVGIVNTATNGALDHYDGGNTIEAYPNNGIEDPHHHWILTPDSCCCLVGFPKFSYSSSFSGAQPFASGKARNRGRASSPKSACDPVLFSRNT